MRDPAHYANRGPCKECQCGLTDRHYYAPNFENIAFGACVRHTFLAHLSQRLIGELIVYPCSGVRRCCCRRRPPFSNVFSAETAWPIKAKFYVEPPWQGGTKVYINGPGHMTKLAAMPIYGKNLKNLPLQNQKSYDLETWHVASGTQALQSLYK